MIFVCAGIGRGLLLGGGESPSRRRRFPLIRAFVGFVFDRILADSAYDHRQTAWRARKSTVSICDGARTGAKKRGELKLDVNAGFDRDPYERRYSLGAFNIHEKFASQADIHRLTVPRMPWHLYRIVRRLKPYYRRTVLVEPPRKQFSYDPNVLRCRDDVYLFGFWQHASYFADSKELLREEFTLRHAPSAATEQVARRIRDTPSLCVHVRRLHGVSASGSTLSDGVIQSFGQSPLAYYTSAAEFIALTEPTCEAFVFADDPQWAKEHLKLPFPATFVMHNGPHDAHEDLHLMSLCKHFIIPNSTLSWWGAWLGRDPQKIVCAPRRWYTDRNPDLSGLLLPGWKIF